MYEDWTQRREKEKEFETEMMYSGFGKSEPEHYENLPELPEGFWYQQLAILYVSDKYGNHLFPAGALDGKSKEEAEQIIDEYYRATGCFED
jgi:hypothetical protein